MATAAATTVMYIINKLCNFAPTLVEKHNNNNNTMLAYRPCEVADKYCVLRWKRVWKEIRATVSNALSAVIAVYRLCSPFVYLFVCSFVCCCCCLLSHFVFYSFRLMWDYIAIFISGLLCISVKCTEMKFNFQHRQIHMHTYTQTPTHKGINM